MRITSGLYRGRNIVAPKGDAVRPTSDRMRQAIFNILGSGRFLDGAGDDVAFDLDGVFVLDAFCGTGALGLEAISRGAGGCVFIDRDRVSLSCARQNAESLKPDADLYFQQQDTTKIGPRPGTIPQAGLVFVDPPYRKGLIAPALSGLAQHGWLAPQAVIVMESEAQLPEEELPGFAVLDTRPYGDTLIRFALYTG